ncbi:MAG: tripartite tricarboxylate transporter TctB family protein [Thermodesulfobacteriota bacterium]
MKNRYGSLIFTLILFFSFVVLLFSAAGYPGKAKLFPLIIIPLSLILLGIEIVRDVLVIRGRGETKKADPGEKAGETSRGFWDAILWIVISLFGSLLFGFVTAFFLLPLVYSKTHKESWWTAILLSLGCGVVFYIIFGYVFDMRLFEGFLVSFLFD